MRKIELLTLVLLIISLFTACTNQQTADNNSPNNTQKVEVAVTNEIEGKATLNSMATIYKVVLDGRYSKVLHINN